MLRNRKKATNEMITVTKINKDQWQKYFTKLYETGDTPFKEIELQS